MHSRWQILRAITAAVALMSVLVLAATGAGACERGDTPRPESDVCGQER